MFYIIKIIVIKVLKIFVKVEKKNFINLLFIFLMKIVFIIKYFYILTDFIHLEFILKINLTSYSLLIKQIKRYYL